MELLIPGLALVALMVYASTRIKKTAAAAFEAETVESDTFSIDKPEGFLSVVNGDPGLEFEAYSREYGDDGAEDFRQAIVEVRRYADLKLEAVKSRIKQTAKVVSSTSEILGERKYLIIEAERVENGIGLIEFYKVAADGADIMELKIIALEKIDEAIARKINSLVTSFLVK